MATVSDFQGFCMPLKGSTSINARQAIRSGKPVVVKFHSPSCGSCASAAPEIQKAACPYRDDAEFLEVNVDQDSELADELKIDSLPFVAAFKGGQLVSKKVGADGASAYEKFIQRLLKR